MFLVDVGVAAPLTLQLYDATAGLWAKAVVSTSEGSHVATVMLIDQGGGLYTGEFTPSSQDYYVAVFTIYTDGTYATPNIKYEVTMADYRATPTIAAQVWDAELSQHTEDGTFGEGIGLLAAPPSEYEVIATVTIFPSLNQLETILWLTQDRSIVTGATSAYATIYDTLGDTIATLPADTSQITPGIFRFLTTGIRSLISINQTYVISAHVVSDSVTYSSVKTFTVL
jgi:hypothetical protein